ncbi:MAG: hypothetical protein GT601_05890 [Acidaminobacter sp.]|uniref:replicative helicase loader/inhibitor n=1 Tax=Acidaminobacter sp. TaxID=1872102 RepID=UPI001381DAEE|nr:replicative helicase loader/inhibitor [Acidaminobacter sp.]MZQ97187.1 hypothetical protein [Acidaminobacter sp.]
MTREEVLKIMTYIRVSYPRWASELKPDDARLMVEIWMDDLKEYSSDLVMAAVKSHRRVEKWPPTIADIIEKIDVIQGKVEPMTGQEAWALVRKALKNGIYNAKREYDFLPKEIQSAIGDHYALKAWAEMDMGELETVVQSQFIKSYKIKSEQKMEYDKLPNDVKLMIEQTTKLIGGE